jgi:GH15 family glucan-1,4-alpha-glucosidase
MSAPIEDYGIIGNTYTAALVSRGGSIDWLCLPRFDSESVFAALLGEPQNGRWLIEPAGEVVRRSRRYRGETGILETEFETAEGCVTVIDFMALAESEDQVDLIRLVRGDKGRVPMRTELIMRFDYGRGIPWVRQHFGGPHAVAGPNALQFVTPVELRGTPDLTTVGEFTVAAGETVPFTMSWYPSHRRGFRYRDPQERLLATETQWHDWSSHCTLQGHWREAIVRSLITLRMLTYRPTGGIVAAATTSLPEWIGGVRNWDYRYCWIRDATLTLYALLSSGYRSEARAWREWLLRAAAGHPSEMQIMYGLAGERRLTEYEIDWLPGYENSRPVRIGNAAYQQMQLDVYGELIDALYACRRYGLESDPESWNMTRKLLEYLETIWQQAGSGHVGDTRRAAAFHVFKIMTWVAFDRAIKGSAVRPRWPARPLGLRAKIAADILAKAYDRERNTFVQYYGARDLDASPVDDSCSASCRPGSQGARHGHGDRARADAGRAGAAIEPAGNADGSAARREACSSPAASGWRTPWRGSGAATRRSPCSSSCSICSNDLGLLSEEYDPGRQAPPRQFSASLLAHRDHQHGGPSGRAGSRLGGARQSRLNGTHAAASRRRGSGTDRCKPMLG